MKLGIMSEAIELLIDAKRLLEEDVEWCQGNLFEYDEKDNITAVCAVGAISRVFTLRKGTVCDSAWINSSCVEARQLLRGAVIKLNPTTLTIPKFNDDPNTTKEDVLLAFKNAIHEAENNE